MKSALILQKQGGSKIWLCMMWILATSAGVLIAQGPLTPPGPPTPVMKTLDQVEPRFPISTAPIVITNPGSYYLTTNLVVTSGDAVIIATNGVSLDLKGFSIFSTADPANGFGIRLNPGVRNITIINGFITGFVTNDNGVYRGPGFESGVCWVTNPPVNVYVREVTVSGCLKHGINLGGDNFSRTELCMADNCGQYGIVADALFECVATGCGMIGLGGYMVNDSYAEVTGSGSAISAFIGHTCYGRSGDGTGVYGFNLANCHGVSSNGIGIHSMYSAVGCYGWTASGEFAVKAEKLAVGCYGNSLYAFIGNSCASQYTPVISNKYNMP